ncbi:MAG: hypothetical protein ACRDD1_05730, partial [Planctomycetia bacterium]
MAEIAPPTNTRLHGIQPEDVSITAGEKITFSAYAAGRRPDRVTVYYRTEGAVDPTWAVLELDKPAQADERWSATLHEVHQSFQYWMAAGNFQTDQHKPFRVEVIQAPRVAEHNLRFEYPAYTGLAPTVALASQGDVDVSPEETIVELEAVTSVAAKLGTIEILYGNESTSVRMSNPKVDGKDDENRLVGRFPLHADMNGGSYKVTFTDVLGRKPPTVYVKKINVRLDTPPAIAVAEPEKREVEHPSNGVSLLRAAASDDFGLDRVRFFVQRRADRKILVEEEVGGPTEPLGTKIELPRKLDLGKIGAVEGDVLDYWFEAVDVKRPTALTSSTRDEARSIRVGPPVEEKKRDEQMKNADAELNKPQDQEKAESGEPQDQPPENGDAPPPDGQPQDGGAEGQPSKQGKGEPGRNTERKPGD